VPPRRARADGGRAPLSVESDAPGPDLVSKATKRKRMPWWPPGVDSELEMKLYTRIQHAGLPLGTGQHRFVTGRQYRFDRCWTEQKVAAEVQGGIWSGGRHARGSGIAAECVKLSIAAALGWRVLPLTDDMIESGQAIELIRQALEIAPAEQARDGRAGGGD
jgi:hypothetical protein